MRSGTWPGTERERVFVTPTAVSTALPQERARRAAATAVRERGTWHARAGRDRATRATYPSNCRQRELLRGWRWGSMAATASEMAATVSAVQHETAAHLVSLARHLSTSSTLQPTGHCGSRVENTGSRRTRFPMLVAEIERPHRKGSMSGLSQGAGPPRRAQPAFCMAGLVVRARRGCRSVSGG